MIKKKSHKTDSGRKPTSRSTPTETRSSRPLDREKRTQRPQESAGRRDRGSPPKVEGSRRSTSTPSAESRDARVPRPAKVERLQKVLARGGVASRRAAEDLIREGRVRVNGRVVTELGTKVDPKRDHVEVAGKRVMPERYVYLVMHKPRGVVSTMSDPEGRPTVKQLLSHVDARAYPVGRLDFATSGVLLATNDGAFAEALLHPRKSVPKTYVVKAAGKMEDADLERWRTGIDLDDGKTLPAEVKLIRHEAGEVRMDAFDDEERPTIAPRVKPRLPRGEALPATRGKTWFEVTIREGRNQQIRRMGEASGFPIMRLSRTSFAGITSEAMRPGAVRSLTREELLLLKKNFSVPRSIPSEIEPHLSKQQVRGPWRKRDKDADVPTRGRATSSAPHGETETMPRYGMGSPGRRNHDVRDDYGGGSGRGSSGSRDHGNRERGNEAAARPRGGLGGGRFTSSRTTGTGGGIGGQRDGNYRSSGGRKKTR